PQVPTAVRPTPTPTLVPRHPVQVLPPGHEGCGGFRNKQCTPGEFCEYLEGICEQASLGYTGICTAPPPSCAAVPSQPVCGCDGVTYRNDCERRRAGVSRSHKGPC